MGWPTPFSGPKIAYCGTFVNFFGMGIILPFLPFFVDSVEDDDNAATLWVGAIVTGQFVGVVIGSVIMGTVSDKLGPKLALLVALSGNVLFFALSALADTTLLFFLARLSAGTFTPVVPAEAWVIHSTSSENRADALGKFVASILGGFLLGTGSSVILGDLGIDAACYLSSAIAAVMLLVVFLSQEPEPLNGSSPSDPEKSKNSDRKNLYLVLSSKAWTSVALMNFTLGCTFGTAVTIPGLILKRDYDFNERETSLFYLATVSVMILANLLVYKKVLARLKPWKTYLLVCVFQSTMFLFGALSLWLSASEWPFLVTGVLAVMMNAFGVPTNSLVASRLADIRAIQDPSSNLIHGRVLGVTRGTFNIGQAVSPFISVAVFSLQFYAPFVFVSVLLWICLFNFLRVGSDEVNQTPEDFTVKEDITPKEEPKMSI
mmetsp:Transcript_13647/g.16545  ORF Transcript_13647/g.16545 Transcript_13647/m.16545 type:complete len:432 (-) Transcript_13647:276-1571(-)|eukprot:CAMPEP_0184018312 /NCGR_PEP_ID=MMETSP0954-20121128/8075_1 /TAXON_ID=627963 /ORGANISM="Aplanochytrium sp, Strain PBS07" /LENGTH=431 /DNA_ID=CAMNT_0026299751 /DNA_START=156 /DNA_END=1451 /DNA_ORIENTATION=-